MSIVQKIYNSSPILIQNFFCSIYGYKEKKSRFNKIFNDKLSFLIDSEWYSKEAIEDYQNQELNKIIEHSYKYVPYYTELFKKYKLKPSDIKGVKDLVKIPVLTKEDIRRNWQNLVSTGISKSNLVHSHTSGSTGKALDFYLTKESIAFQWAVWIRFRNRYNIQLGDKSLNFTGKLIVPINQKKPPYWRHNRAINQYLINMQHIKPSNIESIVKFINDSKFKFFSGYPSIIYSLAQLIDENKLIIINPPKVILTGAEQLYENQRHLIFKVFNCEVVDHYGFSEGAGNASRCKVGVFHEDFEFGIMELDNTAKISTNEIKGDIICTGFGNYGMPFIRYQVGDVAIEKIEKCTCGRHSRAFSSIEGRSEDYVITPEGTKILRFDYLFKDTHAIKECQVVQKIEGQIIFRIVKRNDYNLSTEKKLKERVKEWISSTIEVEFEYVNEIERTSSGKFKAVKSYINN